MYLGLMSEYNNLLLKNPNLDFDVTMIPQKAGTTVPLTYGNLTGLAIMKASANKQAAFNHLYRLVQSDTSLEWTKLSGTVSARRDILLSKPIDPVQDLAFRSTFLAKTWLDPQGPKTNGYIKNMIEGVVTGRNGIDDSVSRFSDQVSLLLSNK